MGQDRWDRTARAEHPGPISLDKTKGTNGQNMAGRTEQLGQDSRGWEAINRQPGHKRQGWKAGTGQPGQKREDMTART